MADIFVEALDLRRAQHAQDFLVLLDHYAQDPMGGGQALAAEVRDNLVARLQQVPHFAGFMAYSGAVPIGMLEGFFGFSTFAARPLFSIHDIVTHASWRGRGVAQRLLQAAAEMAQTQGCCKLTLEVLSGNQHALAAYRRFGFENYQLDPQAGDAWFMHKKL